MNVGQLKEALDDFGDHLDVVIEVEDDQGEDRKYHHVIVESGTVGHEICVILELGTQKRNA